MPYEGRVTVVPARTGRATLVLDGRYVHSRHDPEREAARALEAMARREPPTIVVLGLGLGYHLAFLLETTECTRLIVVEPDEELVQLARRHGVRALREGSERILLARDDTALEAALPEYAAAGFEVFDLTGRTASDERFDRVRSVLASFADRLDINRNTLQRFGRLWVRNLCRNLGRIALGRGVAGLEGAFAGIPSLLLAAGPTLDQILPRLPELAERAFVVAVDTAVAPSVRAGVDPDFAVVVDPQYWNARHLDRQRLPRTILVSEASTHPSIFPAFTRPVYFCSSAFPLGRAFEAVHGKFGALGTGGSVSTSAWDLARLLGASSVFTAGLDLGFPGGRTHCASSYFEHLALILADRLHPAEQTIFRYTRSADPFPIPANDGSTLLSDRRMAVYRTWFATQVARSDAPATVSITEGGAAIEGVAAVSSQELLCLPPRRAEIDERLRAIEGSRQPTKGEPQGASAFDRMLEVASRLSTTMEDLAVIASRGARTIDELRRRHERGERVDFSALASIDEAINEHAGAAIGSFLIQDTINRIRGGFGSGTMEEQLDASSEIYAGLDSAATYHAQELAAAVARWS